MEETGEVNKFHLPLTFFLRALYAMQLQQEFVTGPSSEKLLKEEIMLQQEKLNNHSKVSYTTIIASII